MSATLQIRVAGKPFTDLQEVEFFDSEEWCANSERELLQKMQDLISSVRNIGISFEVQINFEVKDVPAALFILKKKASAQVEINNQKLSLREIEVLGLIMQGLTNNEIATRLGISYETVKSHRKNILEKTGAKNTASLINYYHQTFFEK